MNQKTCTVLVLALLVCSFLPSLGNAQKLNVASLSLEQDKSTIETAIKAYAKALSDFPSSRDVESVLRFHSKDFAGTEDGKEYSVTTIKDTLNKMLESIRAGSSISVSAEAKNIEVDVQGDTASATYESTVTLRLNSKVVQDSKQRCTDRFSRQGTRWLLEHSTVSSMNESANESSRASEPLAPEPPPPAPRQSRQSVNRRMEPVRIIDETFNVAAGQFRIFEIHADRAGVVTGRFDVGGNRLSDIRCFLIDAREYDNLRNNRRFSPGYASGQVVSDSINVPLEPGTYLLIFSNVHSLVVSATVRAAVYLTLR